MTDLTKPWPVGQQVDPRWLGEELARREASSPPLSKKEFLQLLVSAGISTKKSKLAKRHRSK